MTKKITQYGNKSWQKMVARQFSNTKSALEMAKFGGANKKWREMMATLAEIGGNKKENYAIGKYWWQQKS